MNIYIKKLSILLLLVIGLVFVSSTTASALIPSGGATPLPSGCANQRQCDAATPVAPPPATPGTLGSDAACNQADTTTCVSSSPDTALNGCQSRDCDIVTKYLNPFIKIVGIFTGIAVVFGLVIGGIQYSASGGDPQKAASAKNHIRNAIIALFAFFFLAAFIKFLTPGKGIF